MRDYQVRGLNWMISLYENGINGILADEMVTIVFVTRENNVGQKCELHGRIDVHKAARLVGYLVRVALALHLIG